MILRASARKCFAATFALTCAVSSAIVAAPAAQADTTSTLTVLGTSDVSDSFLVQGIIKPGFERAYPNVTLNYVSSGTGQAIAAAESGQGSALIVHAAALENQFVADGFSLGGPGRAVFYGDFVLAGPADDPAGVLNGSSHDIVGAFEKIAAAGVQGKATFVSRGGTPGTTVSEHSIWPLTTDITTCKVSAANGGGTTPSTTSGDCPQTVTPPSWYAVTGAKQGANVQTADTCAPATFPNGGCYVFTDRGTFQFLKQQGVLKNLKQVVRDNDEEARGGSTLLTNSFHAYAVDPAKFSDPDVKLNPTAAKQFLDYLTLPATQDLIGTYLANTADGAPFLPSAAPAITASTPPAKVKPPTKLTITGNIRNVVPGTPKLSGVTVSLRADPQSPSFGTYTAATAKTSDDGSYSLTYTPVGAATYTVTTPSLTKVERPDLDPTFSDVLSPGTSAASAPVAVQSQVRWRSGRGGAGKVYGTASLDAFNAYQEGQLQLRAARATSTPPKSLLPLVSSIPVKLGQVSIPWSYYLPKGSWNVQLQYVNNGVVLPSNTGIAKLAVT